MEQRAIQAEQKIEQLKAILKAQGLQTDEF